MQPDDNEYSPGKALNEFVCTTIGCVGMTTMWLPMGALVPLCIASTAYSLNRPLRRLCDQQTNNLIAAIALQPQEMKAHAS